MSVSVQGTGSCGFLHWEKDQKSLWCGLKIPLATLWQVNCCWLQTQRYTPSHLLHSITSVAVAACSCEDQVSAVLDNTGRRVTTQCLGLVFSFHSCSYLLRSTQGQLNLWAVSHLYCRSSPIYWQGKEQERGDLRSKGTSPMSPSRQNKGKMQFFTWSLWQLCQKEVKLHQSKRQETYLVCASYPGHMLRHAPWDNFHIMSWIISYF